MEAFIRGYMGRLAYQVGPRLAHNLSFPNEVIQNLSALLLTFSSLFGLSCFSIISCKSYKFFIFFHLNILILVRLHECVPFVVLCVCRSRGQPFGVGSLFPSLCSRDRTQIFRLAQLKDKRLSPLRSHFTSPLLPFSLHPTGDSIASHSHRGLRILRTSESLYHTFTLSLFRP